MEASVRPKKSKGKDQRRLASARHHGREFAEEVNLREYGDVENKSQSAAALKIAFEDIKEKYLKSQAENKVLREKLEMGFKAYDDKYKELEKLKQEHDLKEKENANKNTDGTGHQETTEESEGLNSTIIAESTLTWINDMNRDIEQPNEKKSFTTKSTQTDEEKTDEVALTYIDYQKLLWSCGLEIILQNDKVTLMLTDRDNLKHWLENETDGKISVAFEETPVCERFVQTDDVPTKYENSQQEAMIIKLRSKITDQANVIHKYRQTVDQLRKTIPQGPMVKKETSKAAESKIIRIFANYHQTVLIRSQEAVNHIMSLNNELELQRKYCKHLLQIIKDAPVPKQFLLSVSDLNQQKLLGLREIKKPPESEGRNDEYLSDDKRMDVVSTSGHFSMPVQVSNEQPSITEGGSNTGGESSASVISLSESRFSSGEKFGQIANQSKGHPTGSRLLAAAAAANHSKAGYSGFYSEQRRKADRSISPPGTVKVRTGDVKQKEDVTGQDDDIVVINEDVIAIGGTSGIRAKECPICFMTYSPASSQQEFEAHVGAHFTD